MSFCGSLLIFFFSQISVYIKSLRNKVNKEVEIGYIYRFNYRKFFFIKFGLVIFFVEISFKFMI